MPKKQINKIRSALEEAMFNFLIGIGLKKKPSPSPYEQEVARYQRLANIAWKNMLDQTAFTPQASRYLKGLRVSPYGIERMSSVRNVLTGGDYTSEGGGVGINTRWLTPPDGGIVNTLRHEALHALDYNANRQSPYPMSVNPVGPSSGNSIGFYPVLKTTLPRVAQGIKKFSLSAPIYTNNPIVQDKESFAYFGQPGEQSLLAPAPVSKYYQNIYRPMTKNLNYSPLYPSPELYRRVRGYK